MNSVIRKIIMTMPILAYFFVANGAYAQTTNADIAPPPEKFAITPGGVDIRTGRYAFSQTDLSIGDKSGGIEFNRILSTSLLGHIDPLGNFAHNWDITLLEKKVDIAHGRYKHDSSKADFRFLVSFGGRTDTFQLRNWSNDWMERLSDGPYASLVNNGDRHSDSVVYTYTISGGTKVIFRPLGSRDCSSTTARCAYPSQVINPDGTTFSFEYETTGAANGTRLRSVTNNRGYALLLEYSGSGASWNLVTKACTLNLAFTAKPVNNVCPLDAVSTSYAYTTYNGKPMLASVTDAVGATSTLSYAVSPAGATDGVPNNASSSTNYSYAINYTKAGHSSPWQVAYVKVRFDREGTPDHVVGRQSFSDGSRYDYSYTLTVPAGLDPPNIAGGTYTDALGHSTGVYYDSIQLPYDAWVSLVRKGSTHPLAANNTPELVNVADGGLGGILPDVYTYEENPWMQMTSGPTTIIDSLGRTTFFDYCERTWNVHSTGCMVGTLQAVTDPENITTNYWYRSGHIEKTQQIAKSGTGLPDIVKSVTFTCTSMVLCGKPQTSTDPKGNVTNFTYDPVHGGILTVTSPAPTSGSISPQKRYTYQQFYAWYKNSVGTIVQADTPVWLLTTISECRTLANCVNTADETRTTIAYGMVGWSNNLLPTSVTIAAGDGSLSATTTTTYDTQGNPLSVDGPIPGGIDTTRTHYDAMRRIIGTVSSEPDGFGPLKFRAIRNTYNLAGDLIKVEKGTVLSQYYSDWPLFTPLQAINTDYDLMGRKVRESVLSNGVTYAVTGYSYDLAQQLECTAVRMDPAQWGSQANACVPQTNGPNGPDRITRNIYNAVGERIKVQVAVGTADQSDEETTTYTNNRKIKTITDGEGNLTTYTYDGLDRLFKTQFPYGDPAHKGTSSATDFEQFAYDLNGNTIQHRLRDGQLINFGFDNLNRQTLKDLPSIEVDVTSGYDLQNHLLQATQGGSSVTLTWDALGRNRSETTQLGTMTYDYDWAGRRIHTTWPDGFYISYDYFVTGETKAIREYDTTSGIGVLATYDYDNLGRRVSITRGNGTVTNFTYDGASRLNSLSQDLAGTSQDVASTFIYNSASQITNWTRNNNAYAWTGHSNVNKSYGINGLNQIESVGGINFNYDDHRGNLTRQGNNAYSYTSENRLATGPNGASFTYDPTGRLLQSVGSSGTTRFQYDGTDLVAEYNASNQLLRRYVHGPGADEPLVWYEGAGTADRRWLHQDEHSSIVAISNATGTTTTINSYDEYGIPAPTNLGRFQYTGQTWMPDIGMYYYKARIYDPKLGRFLQTDPIGYKDQMNLYAYVGNDPVNKADPTGNAKEKFVAEAVMLVGTNIRTLGRLTMKQAIEMRRNGKDIRSPDMSTAKKIEKAANPNMKPTRAERNQLSENKEKLFDENGNPVMGEYHIHSQARDGERAAGHNFVASLNSVSTAGVSALNDALANGLEAAGGYMEKTGQFMERIEEKMPYTMGLFNAMDPMYWAEKAQSMSDGARPIPGA